jgi:hypothetical protein
MQTGNHLVCSRQYPRTACVLCAVQWVWSPSDNVPNREEAARRTPLRESRSVKGQGRGNRARVLKEPHAPSSELQTYRD